MMRIDHIPEEEFQATIRQPNRKGRTPSPETVAVLKALQKSDAIKLSFEHECHTQSMYNRLKAYFRVHHLGYYVTKRDQCLYVGKFKD